MSMLSRRLLMWGGAAAVASAGFAFMASNSLAVSGAGENYQAIAGYTVSNITWNGGSGSGCGGDNGCYLSTVTFNIASKAAPGTQAYENPPNMVYAAILHSGHLLANADGCTYKGTEGPGAWQYLCTFNPQAPYANSVNASNQLDVMASQ